jgi:hypothetical protein
VRTILVLLAAIACPLACVLCLRQIHVELPPPPPALVKSQGPTILQLEKLSQLTSSRVSIVDTLVGQSENSRGVWLLHGDALIATDLSKAVISEKDEAEKKAIIRLPQPVVVQARVNHEKTRVFEVKSTSWLPWRSDQDELRDEVMLQAQRLVASAAGSKENIAEARRHAEAILSTFFEQLGWNVKVIWVETPGVPGEARSH